MGIGTSLGAFYEDDHHYNSSLWDPERYKGDELMVKTPDASNTDKQLDNAELNPSTGMGIEVAYKANPSHFAYDKNYDTKLPPKLEGEYQQMFKPEDSTDYDMRGWFFEQWLNSPDLKVNPNSPGMHYTDLYKKPNHATFSMDSKYNGVDGNYGGVWGNDEEGNDTFKPSSTNLKNLGKEGLQDYFKQVEPKAKLLLDEPQIEDRRDEQFVRTYQEILDDANGKAGQYSSKDNKELERSYTQLEKEAGMKDLDRIELDQLVNRIQKGVSKTTLK